MASTLAVTLRTVFKAFWGAKPETFTEILVKATGNDPYEVLEDIEEIVGGPTWTRTRDQPVMSRWL